MHEDCKDMQMTVCMRLSSLFIFRLFIVISSIKPSNRNDNELGLSELETDFLISKKHEKAGLAASYEKFKTELTTDIPAIEISQYRFQETSTISNDIETNNVNTEIPKKQGRRRRRRRRMKKITNETNQIELLRKQQKLLEEQKQREEKQKLKELKRQQREQKKKLKELKRAERLKRKQMKAQMKMDLLQMKRMQNITVRNDVISLESPKTIQNTANDVIAIYEEIHDNFNDTKIEIIGDFSCIKNGFIAAPEIQNADTRYLRNDNLGPINAYLEVEYLCRPGFTHLNDKANKLICKNSNWIGERPFCEKLIIENYYRKKSLKSKLSERFPKKLSNCKQNQINDCDHICYEKNNKSSCLCHKGFRLIGHKCIDINECRENKAVCEFGCSNTIGSYRCKCPKGLKNDGANKCVDVNECVLRNGHGMCQDKCINKWGSYQCTCDGLPGSKLSEDNHSCEDVDECSINNGGCSHTCLNTLGQAFCVCPDGWILDEDWKTCIDIDECTNESLLKPEDRCMYGCINTLGSFKCVTEFGADQPIIDEIPSCPPGYYYNSTTEYCEDINECEVNNGGCFDRCINTIGNFDCICSSGFIFGPDKYTCIVSNISSDVACPPLFPPRHGYLECSRPVGPRIINRPGSQCILRCPTGFRVVGRFSKICGIDGKWLGNGDGVCMRHPTPKLVCPKDIHVELSVNSKSIQLDIPHPKSDVNYDRDIMYEPSWIKNKNEFEIGKINVSVKARHPISKLSVTCNFEINIEKGEPPKIVYCPNEIQKYVLSKQHEDIKITWVEPNFSDNINVTEVLRTNNPGNLFGFGSHQIIYVAKDKAGYSTRCIFKLLVTTPKNYHLFPRLPIYKR